MKGPVGCSATGNVVVSSGELGVGGSDQRDERKLSVLELKQDTQKYWSDFIILDRSPCRYASQGNRNNIN